MTHCPIKIQDSAIGAKIDTSELISDLTWLVLQPLPLQTREDESTTRDSDASMA